MNIFDLVRFLWVFGFTVKIIQVTNDLTVFKSPRDKSRKKLAIIGLIGIVTGIFVALVSKALGGTPVLNNESIAIEGTGTDIIALGFTCILQSISDKQKYQKVLGRCAVALIIIGLIIGIIGIFIHIPI
jgi:hypothetical protein